jgi:hypothetical protein
MKLQMIVSKNGGKGQVTKEDVYNIEGCSYDSRCPEGANLLEDFGVDSLVSLKTFKTNSKNLKDAKDDNGKNAFVEIDNPYFRDINKFYQEVLGLKKHGIDVSIEDSKISEKEYDLRLEFDEPQVYDRIKLMREKIR